MEIHSVCYFHCQSNYIQWWKAPSASSAPNDFFLIKSELAAKLLINQVITAFTQCGGSLFLYPLRRGWTIISISCEETQIPQKISHWRHISCSCLRLHSTFCCVTEVLCAIWGLRFIELHLIAFYPTALPGRSEWSLCDCFQRPLGQDCGGD